MVGLRRMGPAARAVLPTTARNSLGFFSYSSRLSDSDGEPSLHFYSHQPATSEFAGSITTTSPVQSSLKMVCLQLGRPTRAYHRQVLHAYRSGFLSALLAWLPPSLPLACPSDPPESILACLEMAV